MRLDPAFHRLPSFLLCLALLCLLAGMPSHAQQATPTPSPDPMMTHAYRPAAMFAGPGETHELYGWLEQGLDVRIVERNATGNWVHVVNEDWDIDAWVLTGYLTLATNLRFSEVPVNTALPDANLDRVPMEALTDLYTVPVIPTISDAMRDVFERGLELGNHPDVVTKVGDSISADPLYLSPMSQNDYVLGPYDYLEDTIRFFGPSTARTSVAARVGMTSYVIFDPTWANAEQCEPNETPLACEYRISRPSIALIMFGANDVRHIGVEQFDGDMRQIVDQTLAQGIIPVITMFSANPEEPYFWQSVEFDRVVAKIGEDYEIPIINLWSAARIMLDYGLDQDLIHLTHSGFRYLKYDTGHEAWFGLSLWNLLTIRTLDELRRSLDMDAPLAESTRDATAESTGEPS